MSNAAIKSRPTKGRPTTVRPVHDYGSWQQQVKRALVLGAGNKEMAFVVETLARGEAMTDQEKSAFNTIVKAACSEVDTTLSEYPLGVLMARGIINADQHQAGQKFAALYAKATGRMAELGFDPGQGDLDEESQERIEKQYVECREMLVRNSRRAFDSVVNICVYRRTPRWAKPFRYARPSFERDKVDFIKGLDLLAAALIGRKAKAG